MDPQAGGDGKSRKRKSVSPARNESRGSFFKSHDREYATRDPGKLNCWPILFFSWDFSHVMKNNLLYRSIASITANTSFAE